MISQLLQMPVVRAGPLANQARQQQQGQSPAALAFLSGTKRSANGGAGVKWVVTHGFLLAVNRRYECFWPLRVADEGRTSAR
jgi:hypothetical protein